MKKIIFIILIFCFAAAGFGQNFSYVEYFIDEDPGYGMGTTVSVPGGADISIDFESALNSLDDGLHTIFVRARHGDGSWSQTINRSFLKQRLPVDMDPEIVYLEYFFDSDPGFGQANLVELDNLSPLSITANLPLQSLNPGLHSLYVRSKDENGRWSIVMQRSFVVSGHPDDPPIMLVGAEYFIDNDPGPGNGEPVMFSPNNGSVIQQFETALDGYEPGEHRLYVRSKDENGSWSIVYTETFEVEEPPIIAEFSANVTAGSVPLSVQFTDETYISEPDTWFWDFGDGTTSTVQNPQHTYSDPGSYTVSLTATGPEGSDTEVKEDFITVYPPLYSLEYFFDEDPGYGNGTPVYNNSGISEVFEINIPLEEMEDGLHTLFARIKDTSGVWTHTFNRSFLLTRIPGDADPLVNRMEYFMDEDPGYGQATPIAFNPDALPEVTVDLPLGSLSPGLHTLYVRSKDENGRWSIVMQRSFLKGSHPNDPLRELFNAEYFIDTDPGFGNGTQVLFDPNNGIHEQQFEVNLEGYTSGEHTLYVRGKDDSGSWSITHTETFEVEGADIFAAFSAEPTAGVAPLTVQFTDESAGDPVTWEWDFENDGTIDATIQHPEFTYSEPGTYSVALTISDGEYSDTEIKEEFIIVLEPLEAAFSADITSGEAPLTVQFSDQSTGNPTSWEWDFENDGTPDSYLQNPEFIYTEAGIYAVALSIANEYDQDTEILLNYITVTEPFVCLPPVDLSAAGITSHTADLSWNPGGNESEWNLLWGETGFDPLTEGTLITGITETYWNLTGLAPGTDYDFYVKAICSPGEASEWSDPESFTTETGVCSPNWEPSPYYQFNMQVIAEIYIEGELSLDPNDKIGAFVDDECRGIAAPDPELSGLVFLSIGSNEASGEIITFKIWDVDLCTDCPVSETITFENQAQIGTPSDPYLFQCGQYELSLEFGEGYTWFSVNVNPGSMHPDDIFNDLQPCQNDRILGQNSFAVYYDVSWLGSLTELSTDEMYKMQLCSQQNQIVEGEAVGSHPINLGEGFTWLGYLPDESLSINYALGGLQPFATDDDRIISQNAFAVNYQGQWVGSLTQMHPGKGYIIELSEESTLLYPDATGKENPVPEQELFNPAGEKLLTNQQFTMMVIAQLELPDGSISINSEDVVYAYSNEECRGIAVPDPNLNGRIFMSVGSDVEASGEIYFRTWLSEYEMEVDIRETISFESLKKAGTMLQPELFTLKGFTHAGESFAEGIYIGEPFPNPFTNFTEINCHLTVPANLKLSVLNARGQQLAIISDREFSAGNNSLIINRNDLPPGVYFFRLEIIGEQVSTHKLGKLIIR
jgi:PKD repeat protein